jgi:PKD repeat protein
LFGSIRSTAVIPFPCTSTFAITFTITNAPCNGNVNFNSFQGPNGNVQFFNTSIGLSQNATWSWSFGDGGTSNLFSPVHTYTASGFYNITLTGTDQLGICSYSSTQNVSITVASCSLTSAFSYTTVGGGVVNFSSLCTGTTGTTSYYWGFGDGGTSNAINPSHTYTSNGIYNVSLMVNDSVLFFCSSTSNQPLNLNLPCMANVNFNMYKDSVQMPAIVWNAFPNYPLNIVAANWSWGDGSSTLALYPSHTYSTAGLYSICVSVTVTCGSTATSCFNTNIWKSANPNENNIAVVNVVSSLPTSIKRINTETFDFKLFPNPNNGEFELALGNIENCSEILIYNLIGQEVYRSSENLTNANLNKKINLSELSNGTYFIRVNSDFRSHHSKFIINK